ncbi:hypothetical protein NR289_26255, partial [Enterobacter kobei]
AIAHYANLFFGATVSNAVIVAVKTALNWSQITLYRDVMVVLTTQTTCNVCVIPAMRARPPW